jgi:outer membrane receptor protein involved in Fe transport
MQVEVTSVSKKAQPLFDTPAAIYVITQEDIRRSGATSIPEALRMAPGVDVARINANTWAISISGFNNQYASKLLVLIDGRSVYAPLFAGVYWNSQDTLIEDIERIEVIRGPGGTIWGANAVNGVINIITKSAKDTTGGLVTTGWRLAAGYSYLELRLSPNIKSDEGSSPHNQFHLSSHLDLPGHFEFDAALYYVDNLPTQGVASYIRPDIRLGW